MPPSSGGSGSEGMSAPHMARSASICAGRSPWVYSSRLSTRSSGCPGAALLSSSDAAIICYRLRERNSGRTLSAGFGVPCVGDDVRVRIYL